ncbi:MAG: HAD family hydrolase [Trichloromonas sp.]|jgi:HAD superfamily hydrolase (TIGR01509 family)|nr:HAD family hydrolase [Trichloromonas sp.]
MKAFKGIIYDCDGVLFESRQANLAYYNRVQEYFGEPAVRPEDEERAHLCHTAASPKVFEVLLGPDRVSAALEFAATVDYRQFIPSMEPEPGMVEALATLARRLPLAVATNRGTSMPEILRHFELCDYFSAVVTSRDVPRPKPHPDMLLLAAERLQRKPEELLFIGDSELDRDAAVAAGISFASYKGELGSDIAVRHHAEVVRLVFGGDVKVEA